MAKQYDAFISYSHHDREFVERLTRRLIRSSFKVFFDEADFAVGASLAESIFKAVEDARYVLVVMSPAYFGSAWATQELELALSQEFKSDRTKVIPLLYRDCEIPPLLRTKLHADVRTDEAFEKSFPKLVAVLARQPLDTTREVKEEKGTPVNLGSIPKSVLESDELRIMINDLKTKVEAFIEKSETVPSASNSSSLDIDPNLCFVVMPFGSEELNDVYEYFVKPSIENHCNLRCERADDLFGSNVIMEDIRKSIGRARLVVAELTGRNPNVFYEVGIAHTLNKDVLLLSQSISDVPFDLRHRRVLVYDYTPRGCKKLEGTIVENVNAILKGGA